MQYILSEEEYKSLVDEPKKVLDIVNAKLQLVCTMAAINTPIKLSWRPNDEPQPWGCILAERRSADYSEYCDDCPVRRFCPCRHKQFSK